LARIADITSYIVTR